VSNAENNKKIIKRRIIDKENKIANKLIFYFEGQSGDNRA
jgi:hypothetical protein